MASMIENAKETKAPAAGAGKGQARRTVDKWKKKKWFTVNSSSAFDKKPLADTPAEKPKNIMNRTIRTTLDVVTGNRMKRDYYVYFKVFDVQGQTASTKISKFEVVKAFLGRTIRRRNSKIALMEKMPVLNGEARFTIALVTERKATRSQEAAIREIIKKDLLTLKGKDFEDISKELLLGNFSNDLAKKASKIFSVKKAIPVKGHFTETK